MTSLRSRFDATAFGAPASDQPRKLGSTFPAKTHISFDGAEVTSSDELATILAVNCGEAGPARVVVRDAAGAELPVDGALRFADAETGWICNLRLDAPAFRAGGVYRLTVRVGAFEVDGVEHILTIR